MHKILPANAVEVGHNTENFILVFRFQCPDGAQESVTVATSPAGAKTTHDLLAKEIQEYEEQTGHAIEPWKRNAEAKPNGTPTS